MPIRKEEDKGMLSKDIAKDMGVVHAYEQANHPLFCCVYTDEQNRLAIETGRLYTYKTLGKGTGWIPCPVTQDMQEQLFYSRLHRAKKCEKNKPRYFDPEIPDDFRSEIESFAGTQKTAHK